MSNTGLDILSLGLNSSLGGNKRAHVPELPPINIEEEQTKSIAGNQKNLGAAQNLAAGVNRFNQSELEKMYAQALPGYENIKQNIGQNLTALTNGEIPQDVQDQILRNAAIKSLNGGYGGSGMARNLSARDLGLTSLGLQGQGQDATQRWLQQTTAPQFDVSSMFITPQQRLATAISERDTQFNRNWMDSQVSSLGSVGQQAARNMLSNY